MARYDDAGVFDARPSLHKGLRQVSQGCGQSEEKAENQLAQDRNRQAQQGRKAHGRADGEDETANESLPCLARAHCWGHPVAAQEFADEERARIGGEGHEQGIEEPAAAVLQPGGSLSQEQGVG